MKKFTDWMEQKFVPKAAKIASQRFLVAIKDSFIAIMPITMVGSIAVLLNVFFRDLEYILNIIVMMWFYLTPIVYNIDMIPERHRFWFYLNPMTGIINFYRDILYYKRMPSFNSFGGIIIYGIIMIIIGYFVFEKLQKNFAEEL